MKKIMVFLIFVVPVVLFAKTTPFDEQIKTQNSKQNHIVTASSSLQFFIDCLKRSYSIACNKEWKLLNSKLEQPEVEKLRDDLVVTFKSEQDVGKKNIIRILIKALDSSQAPPQRTAEETSESKAVN